MKHERELRLSFFNLPGEDIFRKEASTAFRKFACGILSVYSGQNGRDGLNKVSGCRATGDINSLSGQKGADITIDAVGLIRFDTLFMRLNVGMKNFRWYNSFYLASKASFSRTYTKPLTKSSRRR